MTESNSKSLDSSFDNKPDPEDPCLLIDNTDKSPVLDNKTIYTRDFILQCNSDEVVIFLSDVPFRKPKQRQPRLKIEELTTTENAWSQNRKTDDEFEEIKKQSLSLLNKLTMEKYDKISEKFIELMKGFTLTEDQLNIYIPNIYIIIQKQLLYNNTFSRMFKKYNNKEFNQKLEDHVSKEFLISIGSIEDDRNITSMLEDVENVKKRYALNNISFLIDLYSIRLVGKEKINEYVQSLIDLKNIDLLCYFSKNLYKIHKNELYQVVVDFLKSISKDTQYKPKTRFQCMDVLDAIC